MTWIEEKSREQRYKVVFRKKCSEGWKFNQRAESRDGSAIEAEEKDMVGKVNGTFHLVALQGMVAVQSLGRGKGKHDKGASVLHIQN